MWCLSETELETFFLLPFIFLLSGIQAEFMSLHFFLLLLSQMGNSTSTTCTNLVCGRIVNMLDSADLFNRVSLDW